MTLRLVLADDHQLVREGLRALLSHDRRLEVVGTNGMLTATDTMGQTAGGSVTFTNGADGRVEDIPFDRTASPFLEQVRAFGRALHDPEARAAWDAERDLHTMRLIARAYAAAGLKAGRDAA